MASAPAGRRCDSIVSPSNGSLDPNHGTLASRSPTRQRCGLLGTSGSSGIGAGPFSGTPTPPAAPSSPTCRAGNYTVTPTAPRAMVDTRRQNAAGTKTGGRHRRHSPRRSPCSYDQPGAIPVAFKYRVGSTATLRDRERGLGRRLQQRDDQRRKAFGTPGGDATLGRSQTALPVHLRRTPSTPAPATPTTRTPKAKSAGGRNRHRRARHRGGAREIQLPALDLTVKNGSTPIKGAKVTVTDDNCTTLRGTASSGSTRPTPKASMTATPAVAPEATEPGLPWGEYEVCASAKIGHARPASRRSSVAVQSLTSRQRRSPSTSQPARSKAGHAHERAATASATSAARPWSS